MDRSLGMKVYYFLYSLEKEDFQFFLERTWMINTAKDVPRVIDDCFFRIGGPVQGRTKKTAFLEAMTFLEFFLAEGLGGIDDVEWVHAKNFVILNENLYELKNNTYQPVAEDALFVTTRDSWKNPFFNYIDRFLGGKVRLMRPNLRSLGNQADKLNNISKLWSMRQACIGDIIIPLLRNKHVDQVQVLLDFTRVHLGDHIVIKNNFGVEGQKVRALNLNLSRKMLVDMSLSVKQDFFDIGVSGANNPYLVRRYQISKEFRIYFTHTAAAGITIYSVKNRENFPKDDGAVLGGRDFSTSTMEVVWHYQHPDAFCRDELDAFDLCKTIIPLLGAEIGVLELCREVDGSIRFLEMNPLGGALLHSGPDQELMRQYYRDMWANLFSG